MAEYDAFGREVGETTTEAVPPTPTPTPTPTPDATPTPESPATTGINVVGASGGSGFSFGGLAIVLGTVVLVAAIAGGVYLAIHNTTSTVSQIQKGFESQVQTPTPTSTPAPAPKPAAPPVGLNGTSLIRAGAMKKAITTLRHGNLGTLTNLRIAADRIDAQLLTKRGELRSVQFEPDGTLRKLSLSGTGFGSVPTLPISAVDTAAPQRLLRAAAHRHRVSPKSVDYLVFDVFAGHPQWIVFFKDGAHYTGDAAGRL